MSQRKLFDLRIDAEPGVSIVVVDSQLAPVAESVGRLDQRLPPGLYGLQFTAGHAFGEDVVRLGAEGLRYRAQPMDFATPLPVTSGAAPDEATEAIARVSRRPGERIGTGSELLVAVRDDGPLTGANLAAGLSLLGPDGRRMADLAALAEVSGQGEHPAWAAVCLECDEGAYRLRSATGSLTLEQTVMLTEGWQTQVFLDRKSWAGVSRRRRASLPDASVVMARRGLGFDPTRADLRLSELARIALLDRRQVIGEQDLQDMVYGKFDNPMLGLYSAYVLLLGDPETGPGSTLDPLPRATRSLLAEIRDNLRDMLGNHPDVMVLDLVAGEKVESVRTPPMLRCSWEALVTASAEQPHLVAADSLAGYIADQLFGSGVWLTWRKAGSGARLKGNRLARDEDAAGSGRRGSTTDLSFAVQRLSEVVGEGSSARPSSAPVETGSELSSAAQSAIALASALAREPRRGGRTEAEVGLTDERVVEALAVPRSVAELALEDALDVFGET